MRGSESVTFYHVNVNICMCVDTRTCVCGGSRLMYSDRVESVGGVRGSSDSDDLAAGLLTLTLTHTL